MVSLKMLKRSKQYGELTVGFQSAYSKSVGMGLTVLFMGLVCGSCATVDATVDKVKAEVSDRFSKDEEPEASSLQTIEGAPDTEVLETEPAAPAKKPLLVEVQEKLRTLGYYSGPISGRLDSSTEAAIQDFQLDHDLRINGRPSKPLLEELDKVLELI